MELTTYACLDVIEDSLTDGKTCSFACHNDASVVGTIECICDNDENAVSESANCKWKFPSWTPQCGPVRMDFVDAALLDLDTENDLREAAIVGINVGISNLEGNIDQVNDAIAENTADILTKHAEAIQAVADEGTDQDADRATLQAALEASISDLEASDINQMAIITGNGDILADVVELVDDHNVEIQDNSQTVLDHTQILGDHSTDIASLQAQLDTSTGDLLTALNNQILKQETEHHDVHDDVDNNYLHFTEMDDILDDSIQAVRDDLADSILDAAVRDQDIADQEEKFTHIESDIDSNTDLIQLTLTELNDKFMFLTNYTDNAVESKGLQIESDMDTLEATQDAANDALAAEDTALWNALNVTQWDLDEEELRGDEHEAELGEHADELVDLATDVATNVAEIENVQTNLDHEVEVMGLNLNLTESELTAVIDQLRSDMALSDSILQNAIGAGDLGLNNTGAALDSEVASGAARDVRLGLIEADTATIFDNIDDINAELADTFAAMKANDTLLQQNIDANFESDGLAMDAITLAMNEADTLLTATDDQIILDLAATDTRLDEEEVRGQDRDVILADHEERMVLAEANIIDHQVQLDDTNILIGENFVTLDTKIDDTDTLIRTDMATMRSELDAVDLALTTEDAAINVRIDETNAALAIETTRNDDQDTLLQTHADTLVAHQDSLDTLDTNIQTVQTNLDDNVETINELIEDTHAEIDAEMEDLERTVFKFCNFWFKITFIHLLFHAVVSFYDFNPKN